MKQLLALSCAMALLLACTADLNLSMNGGGHEGETRIIGKIVDSLGQGAPNTLVMALPADFNRLESNPISPKQTDTTDADGSYRITLPDSGTYTIQASSLINRTRLLIQDLHALRDSVTAPTAALSDPGAIRVMLPDSLDNINGYLYIPGTTLFAWLADASGSVTFDSVPAAIIPSIEYKVLRSSVKRTLNTGIPVRSNATIIVQPAWLHAKQLFLNTTAAGANVSGTVTDFPVLVRLSSANFTFAQARADGGDLRFAGADGTMLPCEIEQWDAAAQTAAVWVKVHTVKGNNGTQSITMLWGNPAAAGISNSASVFETVAGFQGVWHMGGTGSVPDATVNNYAGTAHATAAAAASGAIGTAREFDGSSAYIQMNGTANSALNFPYNGFYSVSAWVKADTLNDRDRVVVSKDLYQYNLQLRVSAWEFHEFRELTGFESTTAPAAASTWSYVTAVRSGTAQYLYVNDSLVDSTITVTDTLASRVETNDLCIGRLPAYDNYFKEWRYFNGLIDEVRITNVVKNADWIKLCYMNQKAEDALIKF